MAQKIGEEVKQIDAKAQESAVDEAITRGQVQLGGDFQFGMFFIGAQQIANGISSFSLPVTLPKNAVVRQFDVAVRAARAGAALAANVAQMRVNDATSAALSGNGLSVVIDFGTLRTVSAVQVDNLNLAITRVTPWTGAGFAPSPVYAATLSSVLGPGKKPVTHSTPSPPSDNQNVVLPSEIRTERLLVEILGKVSADTLAQQLAVILPEPPADLELTIDGGAPVWKSPGPALAGTDSALEEGRFNKESEQLVKLGDALAALTGDPLQSNDVTFNLGLTTRVPGVLEIKPKTSILRRVWRLKFGSDTERRLDFSSEGQLEIPMELPAPPQGQTRTIEEIQFIAVGNFGPQRVLPPLGPDPGNLADLNFDPARAALVRLAPDGVLAELSGVRLPLTVGAGGAEVRVVLWRNKGAGFEEPLDALPGGTSEPVTLEEGAESWVTFAFKKPVKLDPVNAPWAAIIVARGQVTWNLGLSSGSDALSKNVLRTGAPAGPWKPLPPAFLDAGSMLAPCRGRLRAVGNAQRESPLAPLLVSLSTSSQAATAVTPGAKGAAWSMKFASPAAAAGGVLRVVSHLAGTVTFRDIDVISNV
ncbi:MAG TPA: hypothetical protein VMS96_05605 [Terriglobales bacterium]|nr:hypothetical protein [Terriglobales bacterium]